MTFRLPTIYPITDVQLSGLSHAEQVRRLASGGAEIIQMREKRMTGSALYDAASAALSVARECNVKLIINDRADLVLSLGADGVHLGQDDLPATEARRILGSNAIIGFSTHSLSQATEALKLPVDYLAFGPVFTTSTKADTAPTVGLKGVAEVRDATGNVPLVAIGGITEKNAADVLDAGADSVAMISALLSNQQAISERLASLLQRF